MTVLIWILTFFIGTLINTIIGYATGIKAGVVVMYLLECYVAKKLCDKWKASHSSPQQNNEKDCVCSHCGAELQEESEFCSSCGQKVKE